jgi:hypothetical protein
MAGLWPEDEPASTRTLFRVSSKQNLFGSQTPWE